MIVRVGWATEFGREKFDISVDDGDLETLYHEEGITPALWPQVNARMKYQLLLTLANWFAAVEAARILPPGDAKTDASRKALIARQAHLDTIKKVKGLLGLEESREPATPAADG